MHLSGRSYRTKFFSFSSRVLVAVTLLFTLGSVARAGIIASWTFEVNTPADVTNSATIGPIAADVGTGIASGVHANSNTDWTTPAGNGSANSLSSNTWTVGDYYQFTFSTAGFANLVLTFDHTSSATGPRDFKVQTSLNGTTWTDLMGYSVLENGAAPNNPWSAGTNQPAYSFGTILPNDIVGIRLVDAANIATNGGTVQAGGTSRVDNVTIEGDAVGGVVPEPTSLALLGVGLAGLSLGRRWRRSVA
jgi:hypothetical protein